MYSTEETLAPHGIDEFYPENGSWVIFKYKKLMWFQQRLFIPDNNNYFGMKVNVPFYKPTHMEC